MNLRTYLAELAPTRFAKEWGSKLVWGIGAVGDAFLDSVVAAVMCRFPNHCPEDALPCHGRDRGILKGPAESLTSYRARLIAAWDAWLWGGTETAVHDQLLAYGIDVVIIENWELEWDKTEDDEYWSRFWVVIPADQHSWTSAPIWGSGWLWGDGHAWGIGADPREITDIRRIIRQWKSGATICDSIIVVMSGHYWGEPGLTWGGGWVWGGETIRLGAV